MESRAAPRMDPNALDRKPRVGRDRSQVTILPAPVAQSQLILDVGGPESLIESTKPPMGSASGHRHILADKVRRLLETIGSRGE